MSNTEQTRYTVLLSDHNGLREVATYETPESAADALDNIATGYAAATDGEVRSVTPGRVTVATAGGGVLADLAVLATHRSPEGEPTMRMTPTADPAALDYDLDAILAVCDEFARDAANEGQTLTGAEIVAGFEDAHDMALSEGGKLWLVRKLDAHRLADRLAGLAGGEVLSTGGGCYALVVALPDGATIYATDGDHQPPDGQSAYLSVYDTSDEWVEAFDREITEPHTVEELAAAIASTAAAWAASQS